MYSSNERGRALRWALVPALVLAALAATAIGASMYSSAGQPQYYGWWPWAPFGWFFIIIPLFFIGFFVLRFFWWGGRGWYYQEDPAMQVLRERFARGELTKEQFEQMRKDLGS